MDLVNATVGHTRSLRSNPARKARTRGRESEHLRTGKGKVYTGVAGHERTVPITHVILDWDGTITDIDRESQSFQELYPQLFCERLGIDKETYRSVFEELQDDVLSDPGLGFEILGYDVVPAAADPYLLTQKTIQVTLQGLRDGSLDVPHTDLPDDESAFLIDLYKDAVGRAENGAYFREGKDATKRFLDDLIAHKDIAIVTNSSTAKVEAQLRELGYTNEDISCITIKGNAKKLFVTPSYGGLPDEVTPPGFPRAVQLRRGHYHDVLTDLEQQGYSPESTAVVGDCYELDLALPEVLGYTTVQFATPFTPEHESAYNEGKDTTSFVRTYGELSEMLC